MIKFVIHEEELRKDPLVPDWIKADPSQIKPKRATDGSAGYDIIVPYDFRIEGGTTGKYVMETYVSIEMDKKYYAAMHVRSSIGIKRFIRLLNSTGIIDSDYKDTIKVPLRIFSGVNDTFRAGDRIAQIVFGEYFLTDEDMELKKSGIKGEERNGGIGSTGMSDPITEPKVEKPEEVPEEKVEKKKYEKK